MTPNEKVQCNPTPCGPANRRLEPPAQLVAVEGELAAELEATGKFLDPTGVHQPSRATARDYRCIKHILSEFARPGPQEGWPSPRERFGAIGPRVKGHK